MSTSLSRQDIDKAEALAKKIRRTEKQVPQDKLDADEQKKLDSISYEITKDLCSHSNSPEHFRLRRVDERSLILIATRDEDNDDEFNAIWEPFKSIIGVHGYTAVALRVKLNDTPELSEQSYGFEAAMKSCSIQIKNMLSENKQSIKHFAKISNVHSVYVGAIRSYVEPRVMVDREVRPVEYNVAVYSNALDPRTCSTFSNISTGVTIPRHFVDRKESFEKFSRREFKNLDWYKVVLDDGTARVKILKYCTKTLLKSCSSKLFRFGDEARWDDFSLTTKSEIYKANSDGWPSFIESTADDFTSAISNSVTADSATTRSKASIVAAPNSKKPTPKRSNSAISTPSKPKLVTHRSDRSKAPSEASEYTSDTTPLIPHRSGGSKATPSKPARFGPEKIKATTSKLETSLKKTYQTR
ncbi:hypothetical protein EAE96_011454 [Botrytis aclada]|nr:hypothetical protein EAE96_011454 [Botrytis aclada]